MMNRVFAIRERETGQWWNGFGFEQELKKARLYGEEIQGMTDWISIPINVVELKPVYHDEGK